MVIREYTELAARMDSCGLDWAKFVVDRAPVLADFPVVTENVIRHGIIDDFRPADLPAMPGARPVYPQLQTFEHRSPLLL
jgi:hypothetical protein